MEQGIKNFIHTFKERLDTDPNKSGLNPDRDWRVLILLAVALNLVSAFWNYQVFSDISRNEDARVEGSAAANTLSREKLEEALSYLRAKKEKEAMLMREKPRIVDPSK